MSLVRLVLLASLCLLQPGPHCVVDSSYAVGKVSGSWIWAKSLQKISGLWRFLAIGHVKWGVPHTIINGWVDHQFYHWQHWYPGPFVLLEHSPNTLHNRFVHPFHLSVGLQMVSGWKDDFCPHQSPKCTPKMRYETRIVVVQDRLWNAEVADNMVKKQRSNNRGSETPIPLTKRTRDKACQLRKFVDSYKQTSISLTNR